MCTLRDILKYLIFKYILEASCFKALITRHRLNQFLLKLLYPHHKIWGGYTGFALSRWLVRPSVRLQFMSAL